MDFPDEPREVLDEKGVKAFTDLQTGEDEPSQATRVDIDQLIHVLQRLRKKIKANGAAYFEDHDLQYSANIVLRVEGGLPLAITPDYNTDRGIVIAPTRPPQDQGGPYDRGSSDGPRHTYVEEDEEKEW